MADSGEGDPCVLIQIVGLLVWADLELESDGVWWTVCGDCGEGERRQIDESGQTVNGTS